MNYHCYAIDVSTKSIGNTKKD